MWWDEFKRSARVSMEVSGLVTTLCAWLTVYSIYSEKYIYWFLETVIVAPLVTLPMLLALDAIFSFVKVYILNPPTN